MRRKFDTIVIEREKEIVEKRIESYVSLKKSVTRARRNLVN